MKQKNPDGSTSELYTLEECEHRTKRKISTWRKDILLRKVPVVRIGRNVRIPKEYVDSLIARGWREPLPERTEP